eukprot:9115477-Alexandrium_andersonii.AAC.1
MGRLAPCGTYHFAFRANVKAFAQLRDRVEESLQDWRNQEASAHRHSQAASTRVDALEGKLEQPLTVAA